MRELLYFFAPLLLTIGTTFATMVWVSRHDEFWEGGRVALWLLLADLGVLALAWLVVATAPDQTTSNGVCKDLTGYEVFYVFILGSAVVGGAAWGTASLRRDSGYARLVGYAAVAIVVPYVIAFYSFFATACSWN